ncbi:ArnT family glycosyltransferase [Candidatus Margulisiibacteriota bacterium]
MMILKLLIALLFPAVLGYIIIALSSKDNYLMPLEKLAVSYAIGTGVLTFIMFLMGAFQFPVNLSSILLVCLVLFAYPLVIVAKYFKLPSFNVSKFLEKLKNIKWYEWALLGLISLRVFYSYFAALIKPVQEVDAFANWSLRAKVFFMESGLSLDKARGYFVGNGHTFYPLNIPLFETWVFQMIGSWNDILVKIIFPLFLTVLIIVFYYGMRRYTSRPVSLLSTYLLTTMPFLIYHSTTAYADFPLSVFYFASFIYLFGYLNSKNKGALYISAIFAGLCAWTKNEGFILVLSTNLIVLAAVLFVEKENSINNRIKLILAYLSFILLFKLPWSIFNIYYDVPKHHFQNVELSNIFINLSRIPVIIERFYSRFLFYGNWNIACFAFFVLLMIILIKKAFTKKNTILISVILLNLFGLASVYYLTESYRFLLDGTTLIRNSLIFMPLIIYFIGYNIFMLQKEIEH